MQEDKVKGVEDEVREKKLLVRVREREREREEGNLFVVLFCQHV